MNARFLYSALAALMVTTLVPAASSNDDADDRRVVELTGRDTVRIPATRARLTVMVENEAKSSATAQQVVAQRSAVVRDFLQSRKVDQLQAGSLALHPIYESRPPYGPNGRTEIVGYRAQWSASFEIDADRAGEVADGVVAAGAARITHFEFTATEAALAEAQREALRGAALRAREDAHAVLQALGYEPNEVTRIKVNTGTPVRPFAPRAEMMSADQSQAPTTAVVPGFVEVNGSVELEVDY